MGHQQQPEEGGGGVVLGPGENIDEIRLENDMIKFIFFIFAWKARLLQRKHGKTVFSPISFYFFYFSKLPEHLGLFFNLFDISYQPVSEDSLGHAWRDVGRQQQPEHGMGVALGPRENINEIRIENDMVEFFFTFYLECKIIITKTWQDSIFFSKLIERLGLFFKFFDISYQPVSDDRLIEAWSVWVLDVGAGNLHASLPGPWR